MASSQVRRTDLVEDLPETLASFLNSHPSMREAQMALMISKDGEMVLRAALVPPKSAAPSPKFHDRTVLNKDLVAMLRSKTPSAPKANADAKDVALAAQYVVAKLSTHVLTPLLLNRDCMASPDGDIKKCFNGHGDYRQLESILDEMCENVCVLLSGECIKTNSTDAKDVIAFVSDTRDAMAKEVSKYLDGDRPMPPPPQAPPMPPLPPQAPPKSQPLNARPRPLKSILKKPSV